MTPEFQKPVAGELRRPGRSAAGRSSSGRAGWVVKQGPNTAGLAWPFFSTSGGWSERSLFTPKLTVWMSFDDLLSNRTVSPGRTASFLGKNAP